MGLSLVAFVALAGAAWVAWNANRPAPEPARDDPRVAVDATPIPDRAPIEEVGGDATVGAPRTGPSDSVGAEWSRRNDQGIAALREGRNRDAVAHFEACLAAEPDEAVFAGNLAEALARLARELHAERDTREEALALLTRAVELAPDRADFAAVLDRRRRTAETEDGYWTDESEHFSLSFDGTRAQLMHGTQPLVEELERAYLDFGEWFGRFPVEEGAPKIEVVLYRGEEFREVTGLGHWAGGAFDGVVRIPVEDLAAERRALVETARHELVHAYVAALGATSIPAWLNEGLAQWMAPPFAGGRALAVQHARSRLVGAELFPLADLRTTIAAWTDDAKIHRAYAQSLAFTAWIVEWYGESVLREMVLGAAASTPVDETFRERVSISIDDVLGDLQADLAR